MKKKRLGLVYFLVDWLTAVLAWALFYFFRKKCEDPYFSIWSKVSDVLDDPNFWYGVIGFPLCWLTVYALIGTYQKIYWKSRLRELGQTFFVSLVGVTIIFLLPSLMTISILTNPIISLFSLYSLSSLA
jgi:hypothetical protein